jgi:hypothetical protein
MKNAAEFSRRIRQLYNKVRKDAGRQVIDPPENPTHIMLLGVLANYTTESRAAIGLDRILTGTVDLNDLRVTPVADIVTLLGADFPRARPAAEEVISVLNAIFNHTHDLDLSFLGSMAKKAAAQFLAGLDGAGPHAIAYFRRQYLEEHVVPLDDNMRACMVRLNCLPETATHDEVARFLANVIKEREAPAFYAGLKKYAASHAPRGGKARQASRGESAVVEKIPKSPERPARSGEKPPAAKSSSKAKSAPAPRAGAATGAKKARSAAGARAKRLPTKKK